MTRNDLREMMAQAISGAPFPSAKSLSKADACLSILRDAGLAIIPREPSEAMVDAAIDSDLRPTATYENIYRAMIAAGDLLGERGS